MIDIEMEAKEIEEGQTKDETEEEVKPVEIDGSLFLFVSSNCDLEVTNKMFVFIFRRKRRRRCTRQSAV